MLKLSIPEEDLCSYLTKQINLFFPDRNSISETDIKSPLRNALERLEACFSKITLPYYRVEERAYFNHLHGDHYSMFLYLISNELFKTENTAAASKVFLLNKALFAVDAFYSIELPEHFLFVHPVGTILGKAQYGDFFVAYQGVTIGANQLNKYPSFSERTVLYSNASVIGDCMVGRNFVLGARALIVDTNIGDDKTVVGIYPSHKVLVNNNNLISNFFAI